MVMGVQWLKELGPIIRNFKELSMKFSYGGRSVELRGIVATQLIEEGSLHKGNKLEKRGILLQLLQRVEYYEVKAVEEPAAAIQHILEAYEDAFGEPKGLPPPRAKDHAINLVPEVKPISIRPYRYPDFQKDEIENIVNELLALGVIQPNQSLFLPWYYW